uniref:Uncharacterized protein n=1 Tax=Arundo donax TaxID=35708 RepID=A0A0A8YIQ6_ARUDO
MDMSIILLLYYVILLGLHAYWSYQARFIV